MQVELELEVNADVALSAIVEAERKGFADNVFAQLAQLYSGEKLLHWAQLLTTRPANHTAGNIDTTPTEPAEIDEEFEAMFNDAAEEPAATGGTSD